MFTDQKYVPILKGKEAEYQALGELDTVTRRGLTPLIEILGDKGDRTLEDYVGRVGTKIARSWGRDEPLFVDQLGSGDKTLTRRLIDELRANGVRPIPVTRLDAPLVYQDALRAIAREDDLGVCLRLERSDFDTRSLSRKVADRVDFFDVSPEETHVIIDLADVEVAEVRPMVLAVQTVMAALPAVEDFASITVACSAFPSDMGRCARRDVTRLLRADWLLYRALIAEPGLPRVPAYGDYAIQHPRLVDFDPTRMRMSANIRYTGEDEFVIAKGVAIGSGAGWEQTRELAEWIVAAPEFCGAGFSAGDTTIAERAAGFTGPGGAVTWRKAGTNHHLTFAVRQLASLGAP